MLRMTVSVAHGGGERLVERRCLALIIVSHERRTNSRCPKLSRATSAAHQPAPEAPWRAELFFIMILNMLTMSIDPPLQ